MFRFKSTNNLTKSPSKSHKHDNKKTKMISSPARLAVLAEVSDDVNSNVKSSSLVLEQTSHWEENKWTSSI